MARRPDRDLEMIGRRRYREVIADVVLAGRRDQAGDPFRSDLRVQRIARQVDEVVAHFGTPVKLSLTQAATAAVILSRAAAGSKSWFAPSTTTSRIRHARLQEHGAI